MVMEGNSNKTINTRDNNSKLYKVGRMKVGELG